MKKKLKNQRGETIVEVVVSFLLLLLFTAVFAASLRFARTTSLKAETLRDTAYALIAKLYPVNDTAVDWKPDTDAAGESFTFTGPGTSFTVPNVAREKVEAEATVTTTDSAGEKTETKETYTFHRYALTTENP